ncbi:MAG: hypothetical protein LC623_02140 [Halobacteriales archaeon]|nr:hypothetical protein [Halobacteriales archaeon]
MPQEPGEVEVAQKLNAQRLVQSCLEQAQAAPTPARACLALVRLYSLLGSLRRLDGAFEEEWRTVLDGRLADVVASRRAWRRLTWNHAAAAQEVLLNLMDRHGMGFQAALQDPLDEEQAQVEAELEGEIAALEADAELAEPNPSREPRLMEPTAPESDIDEGEDEDE